jgi:LPXTG-motif cell wall-anchored protein
MCLFCYKKKGMPYVVASEAITNALQTEGYKNVPLHECYVLNQKFKLGENIRFFIDKNDTLEEVNVWPTRNLTGADIAYFSFAGRVGEKAPIKVQIEEGRSLCSLFRAIVAPGVQSLQTFQDYLTLWTKGGGLFGKPLVAALVYHCPVKSRTVSGAVEKTVQEQKNPTGNDENTSNSSILGGTAVLVTIAGLAYWLWKKNRDKKRKQEQNTELLAALAKSLPNGPNSKKKN